MKSFHRANQAQAIVMSMLELVRRIVSEEGHIPAEVILPTTNIMADLGIDSLALVDMVYRLDQELEIEIPIQRWLADVGQRGMPVEDYFVVSALCEKLEALTREKLRS
jgi:acyl carrier protein